MNSTRQYVRFNIDNVKVNVERLDFHPSINTLHRLTFGNGGSMMDVVNDTKFLNKKGEESGTQIAVAYYRGKIIGWSCLDHWPDAERSRNPNRYYIYVYVSTRYRKRGVGSKLLEEIKKFAKQKRYTIKVCGHDLTSYSFFKIKNRMGRHVEYYRDMKDPEKRP